MSRARNHPPKLPTAQKTARRDSINLTTAFAGLAVFLMVAQLGAHVWADARAGRLACHEASILPDGVLCIDNPAPECSGLAVITAELEWHRKEAMKRACWRPDPAGTLMAWMRDKDMNRITLEADPEPDTETEAIALEVAQSEE